MSKTKHNSRRKFLSMALTGSAALASGKVAAQQNTDDNEKIKMLTPDGQLVEVDKSVFDQISNRKQVSNKDIFNWAKGKNGI